jgi:hypothetical protein
LIHRLAFYLAAAALPLAASEMATATYTVSPLGGGLFHYALTLNDTGTTNVGTLWFSWTPGQDYMPTVPSSITAPANWTFSIFGANNAADGSSIRWVANAGFLETPAQSLSGFAFNSMTTPTQMAGVNSFAFGNSNPVATAFIYSAGPFSDAGFQLAATAAAATPEPSSILLTLLGGGMLLSGIVRKIRRRA